MTDQIIQQEAICYQWFKQRLILSVSKPSIIPKPTIDFVINRFFMKLFNINNIEIAKCCQQEFCFSLPSITLAYRTENF